MKHEIVGINLVITVSAEEKLQLQRQQLTDPEFLGADTMYEAFERLICNSELGWVDPSETGDLTSAPMLCIRDSRDNVLKRWAYMNYQIRSPQEDLADAGVCVFQGTE